MTEIPNSKEFRTDEEAFRAFIRRGWEEYLAHRPKRHRDEILILAIWAIFAVTVGVPLGFALVYFGVSW